MDVIALRAFKGPHIGPGRTRFDTSQHHAPALTLWAAGPLNRKKRRFGAGIWLRHVMHPLFGREHNTLSHRWMPMGQYGDDSVYARGLEKSESNREQRVINEEAAN
jgi:hypothetical protein